MAATHSGSILAATHSGAILIGFGSRRVSYEHDALYRYFTISLNRNSFTLLAFSPLASDAILQNSVGPARRYQSLTVDLISSVVSFERPDNACSKPVCSKALHTFLLNKRHHIATARKSNARIPIENYDEYPDSKSEHGFVCVLFVCVLIGDAGFFQHAWRLRGAAVYRRPIPIGRWKLPARPV